MLFLFPWKEVRKERRREGTGGQIAAQHVAVWQE
jgi:hypothetical protein